MDFEKLDKKTTMFSNVSDSIFGYLTNIDCKYPITTQGM